MLASNPRHGGNRQWAATIAGVPPQELLDFSASINPLGPPRSALVAIESHLAELRHYPDPDYVELREALAEFYGVAPEWLLPGNGASDLLTWVGRDLANLETTVIFRPAFADYDRALDTFAGKKESLSILTGALGTEINKITRPDRKGLLLNNPHNPTGKLISKDEILTCLHRFNLVVIDEAFMDFLPPPQNQSCLDLVSAYPNLVILRSLTKFYSLPGLRLGCVIAHPDRIKQWQKWRDPWCVNSLAVAAGIKIVKDREFQQQTWNWLEAARLDLFTRIDAMPQFLPMPSRANFMLVKTAVPGSHLQRQLLKKHKILIRDCLSFAELGEKYIRLAVLTKSLHDVLLDALQNVTSDRDNFLL